MILKKGLFLFSVLFFFFIRATYAQDADKALPLKTILAQIEEQHSVKFSYLNSDISPFKIVPPQKSLLIGEKLSYIRTQTGLSFKQSGKYISVYKPVSEEYICGYIVDEYTVPIEGALIRYTSQNNEQVETDKDGYFKIVRNKNDLIEISHPAYEAITFTVNSFKDDCRTIILKLIFTTTLEEIVTERYLTTGISKKDDGSFIIKPKKFGILPGLIEPDVLQTMQQLPGISSIDETVSNINVRGGTHDQNLFLWNGIRLFQTGHFFGLISGFNPNLPHQIKIYKNGTSAFYGESVSSVVDISSRSENIDDSSFGIGTNMINADFYSVVKLSEKSGLELSARRSFTDAIDLPAYSKYSKRIFQNTVVTELSNSNDVNYKSDKEFYFYDFTGQYHLKTSDKSDLFIDFIGINNELDFTQGTITSTRVLVKNSNLSQLTLGGSATWKSQWNEKNYGEITLYGSYYHVNGNNEALLNNQVVEQENNIVDTGLRLSNRTNLQPYLTLHTGYQYSELGIKNTNRINSPDYFQTTKDVLRSHALIGEAEYNPEDIKFYAKFGLRGNYFSSLSTFLLEPRLQFNYTINNKWKLEALGEFKSQATSQVAEVQQDFLGIEKRRWIMANGNDIPIQKGRQISAGVYYKSGGWQVSLENFYKKVSGITTAEQGFQNQLELLNLTGDYRVFGTEFLVQKQFHGFYAWFSYTWNNNKYDFKEFSQSKFPNNLELKHTVNCAATYEWKKLKLALGGKWFTGRPETIPLSNDPVYNTPGYPEISYASPNDDNIKNFFQVNFSALYSLKLKNMATLQMGISILNVLNKKNIINRYYRINDETDLIEVVNTYSVERTPNAMIRLKF
ncbi:TonB-dependent receptor [Flavobacterium rakeshii]|uniref:TonB-dependent receptor n=1 Tax=Flavobacterium rakeshii TaxID=1038845 RepID=UPI002E7BA644|nr:TonB-dependent receptor [Flavobacterium rakeshii]MEE1896904.1 TonB-dependent receptor [Flavobacterium rakeshii]